MGTVKKPLLKKKKNGARKKVPQKTRKEMRKEKRQQKKRGRELYYQSRKQIPGKYVLQPDSNDSNRDVKVKKKPEMNQRDVQKNVKQKAAEKRLKEMEKQRTRHLRDANVEEDKEIKRLEKQLKLNKRKSKSLPKSFASDGLDYILDFCDEENRKHLIETEKQLLGNDLGDEFDNDLITVIGANQYEGQNQEQYERSEGINIEEECLHNKDNSNHSDSESPEDSSLDELDDINLKDEESDLELSVEKKKTSRKTIKHDDKIRKIQQISEKDEEHSGSEVHIDKFVDDDDDDYNDDDDDDDDDDNNDDDDDDDMNNDSVNEKGVWEDIYGRKRDTEGNIITTNTNKYVPPTIRLKQLESASTDAVKVDRLSKQMKGLLNRLAEHNMHTVTNQIDELYMSNSRNNMNEILSKLMIEAIVSPVLTPDRLISEHMMLIAILHANVGVEVGAHFLLTIVRLFEEKLSLANDVENKELDNLILMISHLYNFKVYGPRLLYEILEKLSEKFLEKEIELILLILRTVGFPLRKDDPAALKELVLKLQQKASSTETNNSRVKFMLDVLLAIKNNNMSKIPQYDPSHVEHLKKQMKSFLRKGNTITPFNITLQDLLHANERGKWWVVGSAWTGCNDLPKSTKVTNENNATFSQKVLELARKQRMNTDTRRNIFCILMTAEDYLDAFEKLHRLGLKDSQEREVIYVLMDCCLHEKKFNPYYAVLAQKFCDYDRKYQMTIQYTLWDKLKTLETFRSSQITNLAQFLTYLFIEKGLPFSALKVIEFTNLNKPTVKLLRQIMLGILLHDNEDACLQVFERISLSTQLQRFRESLRLFVNQFILKNMSDSITQREESNLVKQRAVLVDKLLLTRGNKLVF